MAWLRDRLTVKRLAIVAGLVALAAFLVAIGDPLAHGEAGERSTGERGLVGVPRIVEVTAILVALVLAMPPRGDRGSGDDRDRSGDG